MKATLLFAAALVLQAQTPPMPIRGLHVSAPRAEDLAICNRFIREALPKEGVNVLVLEFDYRYQFSSRPEVAEKDALSKEDVKSLVSACRESGVQLIPMINLLGHQSWAKTTHGLLRAHPEFDETPGKYQDNQGIYCRSYCPLHPEVHAVIFDLVDELMEVAEANAFHAGMDEVFLLGEDDCPRCRGRNKAELFAGEVKAIHGHLAEKGRKLWMWGDRFLDGDATGLGKWEASMNDTSAAIHMIPKDIVISDWHYRGSPPTTPYFAILGFPVVSSPWRQSRIALAQLDQIRSVHHYGPEKLAARMQGVLQTTWCGMGAFVKAYNGENTSTSAVEAARCFRDLFEELRRNGLR